MLLNKETKPSTTTALFKFIFDFKSPLKVDFPLNKERKEGRKEGTYIMIQGGTIKLSPPKRRHDSISVL